MLRFLSRKAAVDTTKGPTEPQPTDQLYPSRPTAKPLHGIRVKDIAPAWPKTSIVWNALKSQHALNHSVHRYAVSPDALFWPRTCPIASHDRAFWPSASVFPDTKSDDGPRPKIVDLNRPCSRESAACAVFCSCPASSLPSRALADERRCRGRLGAQDGRTAPNPSSSRWCTF